MKTRFRFVLFSIILAIFLTVAVPAEMPGRNFNPVRTFDAQHYVIRTSFDRKSKVIFGETTITLKPLKDRFRTILLDSEGLIYSSVKLETENLDLNWRITPENIFITLDKEYSPKDSIKIRLTYTSKPKKGVYFVDESKTSGKPTRASQVWTQGQAAETRHWFPSYDFPDDKATTEQYITVEKGETAISNGEVREIMENPDGTRTFHYFMPLPHSTYLTSFVIGTYAKVEDQYERIPLGFYVYSDRAEIVPRAYGKTKEMMRIFESLTKITYPFNKYDQTIVSKFAFGGMENITASTMSDSEIFLAMSDAARGNVEDLVSHELAHSWFGNLVTCRNWAELWLNEGFATYMEAVFREKTNGRADYIRKIKDDVAVYLTEDSYKKYPHGLFNTLADPKNDASIFNATTYQKGSAVIHMLRETVGDEAFWIAINRYLVKHRFGNVETKDLQEAMEDASQSDLGWFFSQWVYGGGYPKLTVKPVYSQAAGNLTLTIRQTQKSDRLIPNSFILPLEVQIRNSNGTITKKVKLQKRKEIFKFELNQKPVSIEIDSQEKVPLKTVKIQNLDVRRN